MVNRNIIALGFVSFFTDMASAMLSMRSDFNLDDIYTIYKGL